MSSHTRNVKAYEAFVRSLNIADSNTICNASEILMDFIDDVLMSLRASNANITAWDVANSLWGFINGKQSTVADVAWICGVSTHVISGHIGKISGCFRDEKIKRIALSLLEDENPNPNMRKEILKFLKNKLVRLENESALIKTAIEKTNARILKYNSGE